MSEESTEAPAVKEKSGRSSRLPLLVVLFLVGAGAIYGLRYYLKSQIPTADAEHVQERDPNRPKAEEETGLDVISDMFKAPEDSNHVATLKTTDASLVDFTYDEIIAMTPAELADNIEKLSAKIAKIRADLPPSFAGASSGGDADDEASDKPTVLSVALPLAVMKEIAKANEK